MPLLGVNVDHVATLRQARHRANPAGPLAEPSPLAASLLCEQAGAHGITVHLRADRRHIQDADLPSLLAALRVPLNLELGLTPEIVAIALRLRPHEVCLVPENRQEVTTEGGLDALALRPELAALLPQFHAAGIRASLFIDPDEPQIHAAAELRAPVIELHTGAYANTFGTPQAEHEIQRLAHAAALASSLGLQVNAGHGLTLRNLPPLLAAVPGLHTLNIGHSLVSHALAVGLQQSVRDFLAAARDPQGHGS